MDIPQFIYKGFFGGDENVLELSIDSGDCLTLNTLKKITKLYACKG